MSKKLIACLVLGMLTLGGLAGLGVYNAQTAKAANGVGQAAGVTQPATQNAAPAQGQHEAQNPSYTASIRVPNPQDTAEDDNQDDEATESRSLQQLAKITPEQATASALKAVPGQVVKVSLDNENGNVVYSVEIKTSTGTVDVKVDAGNGTVLAQDSGEYEDAREIGGSETEGD
ncbi:MAG: PepSY domain-containing protein [Firmicutes bacterium]|nr:PepSY domain-containing protein [Candidatus Fermentithermobacillaceae bacterium]